MIENPFLQRPDANHALCITVDSNSCIEPLQAPPATALARWAYQRKRRTKKADEAEHPKVLRRIGLLFNEPPGSQLTGIVGLLFILSSGSELWKGFLPQLLHRTVAAQKHKGGTRY